MRRAAIERQRTLRVWRKHFAIYPATGECHREPGRFRKGERVGGCGNARCWLCHAGKLMGAPTLGELRAINAERDGMLEYLLET
jgi:cytochrome c5